MEPGGGGEDPVARGAEIFSSTCAACHGADLEGVVGPALGAGSTIAGMDDATVIGIIADGRGTMPAWDGVLSAEEIEAVLAFLRSEQG